MSRATYFLPTRGTIGLPDLPPAGFDKLSDVAAVQGVRVIREAGNIALSCTADRYAIVRESVQRNFYRIPLR